MVLSQLCSVPVAWYAHWRVRRFASLVTCASPLQRFRWSLASLAWPSHLSFKIHNQPYPPLFYSLLTRSLCSANAARLGLASPSSAPLRMQEELEVCEAITQFESRKGIITTPTGNANEKTGHERRTSSSVFVDSVCVENTRTGNERTTSSSALTSQEEDCDLDVDFSSEEWKDSKTVPSGDEDDLKDPKNALSGVKISEPTDQLQLNHSWDEWAAFVNMLYKKNYFHGLTKLELEHDIAARGGSKLVKHAVMEFGRDRDDIIRFLTKKHISAIVSIGCPSTNKKIVNSSKRLRVLCGLSEEQVCLQCKLKPFCSRAYAAADEQFEAHMIDVARVLNEFALNASPNAESHVSYPMAVIKSACHLLDEFVKLSGYPKAPALPSESSHKAIAKQPVVSSKEVESHPNEMLGEWKCPVCEFLNFSKNKQCRECGTRKPAKPLEPGDWECPECTFVNFRRNAKCRECSTARPVSDDSEGDDKVHMPGDWKCPKCQFVNFRRNDQCRMCATKHPESAQTSQMQELLPGDWKCSKCNFINFRRNTECYKCGSKCASPLLNLGSNHAIVDMRRPLCSTGERWGSRRVMLGFGAAKGWKPSSKGHILDDSDDDELEKDADVIVTHNVGGGLEDDEDEDENEDGDDNDVSFFNKNRKDGVHQSRNIHQTKRMEPEDEESKWARILNEDLRVVSNDLADDEDDDDNDGNDNRFNNDDSLDSWKSVSKMGAGKGANAYVTRRRGSSLNGLRYASFERRGTCSSNEEDEDEDFHMGKRRLGYKSKLGDDGCSDLSDDDGDDDRGGIRLKNRGRGYGQSEGQLRHDRNGGSWLNRRGRASENGKMRRLQIQDDEDGFSDWRNNDERGRERGREQRWRGRGRGRENCKKWTPRGNDNDDEDGFSDLSSDFERQRRGGRGRGRGRGGRETVGSFGRKKDEDEEHGFSDWSDDYGRRREMGRGRGRGGRGRGRGRGTFGGRFGRNDEEDDDLRGRGRGRGGRETVGSFGRKKDEDDEHGFSDWSDDYGRWREMGRGRGRGGRGRGRGRGTFGGRFGRNDEEDDLSAVDGGIGQGFRRQGRERGRGWNG